MREQATTGTLSSCLLRMHLRGSGCDPASHAIIAAKPSDIHLSR